MYLVGLHHIAIIASDYRKSLHFYRDILGFQVIQEQYRAARDSWKADLSLDGHYLIELFSFPSPPKRITQPEACGLRHLAFSVERLAPMIAYLAQHNIHCETVRYDALTQRYFTFFTDPDGLPLELYELT